MSVHRGLPYIDYAAHTATRSGHVIAWLESPRLLKDILEGKLVRKSKPMQFGTHSHMSVLQPDLWRNLLVIEPATYESTDGEKPWSNNAKVCRAWHAAQKANGKEVVSSSDLLRLSTMIERMPREVRLIFEIGEAEVTIRNQVNGQDCQCRVDWLHPLYKYEFKTINNINAIEKRAFSLGYHIQDRFYSRILKAEKGEQIPSRIVFAETNPPYRWRICELDLDFIELADRAIDEALEGIALCRQTGMWDDCGEVRELISPPSWATDDEDSDTIDEEDAP